MTEGANRADDDIEIAVHLRHVVDELFVAVRVARVPLLDHHVFDGQRIGGQSCA